jgi:hypothetical protein
MMCHYRRQPASIPNDSVFEHDFSCARKAWILLGLIGILETFLSIGGHGQPLVTPAAQMAGPWELTRPSGVDGIFVMTYRSSAAPENVQVRVYRRRAGGESGGWYVVSPVKDSAVASFDGKVLRVLGLTAIFDPDAKRWTGEWLLEGERRTVVLERPHPPSGVASNPLCGDWEALPDGSRWSSATSIRVHVVQSLDGSLTAWMDTVNAIIPQRVESETYGRSIRVVSADPRNVVLQNESPTFNVRGRFNGVLSDDGKSLMGTWNSSGQESFRRIR